MTGPGHSTVTLMPFGLSSWWSASLNVKAEDFGWVTRKLMDLADKSAGGRVVSVLEGGYDLQGLQESVEAHVTALMGG